MNLEDIRKNLDLVNALDWDMPPEEAITLYLEWGNNWSRGTTITSSEAKVMSPIILSLIHGKRSQ